MIISKYVRRIEYDAEHFLLHNTYNGALYLIPREEYAAIVAALRNGTKADSVHFSRLADEGFLVEREAVPRWNAAYFKIMIEVPEDEDADCKPGDGSREQICGDRPALSALVRGCILRYVENVFRMDRVDRLLYVRFCGGEPLHRKREIMSICDGIDRIAQKYNRSVGFYIDTDGMVPFDDMLQKLNHLHLSVTLRPQYAADSGKFRQIVENLTNAVGKVGNSVSIRYQTDENSRKSFSDFVTYARKYFPACKNIEPVYAGKTDSAETSHNFSQSEFGDWNASEAMDILIANGYNVRHTLQESRVLCNGYQEYSCRIAPDGTVTNCDFGDAAVPAFHISEICDKPQKLGLYWEKCRQRSCAGV